MPLELLFLMCHCLLGAICVVNCLSLSGEPLRYQYMHAQIATTFNLTQH